MNSVVRQARPDDAESIAAFTRDTFAWGDYVAGSFAGWLDGLDIDLVQITSITFTIRGDDNNFVDELRIGDSYASVAVPEPGALAALLLGIAGLAARASSGRVRLSV